MRSKQVDPTSWRPKMLLSTSGKSTIVTNEFQFKGGLCMKDQVRGKAEEMKGKATGNRAEELKGKARQTVGNAKRAVRDVKGDVREKKK